MGEEIWFNWEKKTDFEEGESIMWKKFNKSISFSFQINFSIFSIKSYLLNEIINLCNNKYLHICRQCDWKHSCLISTNNCSNKHNFRLLIFLRKDYIHCKTGLGHNHLLSLAVYNDTYCGSTGEQSMPLQERRQSKAS